MTFKGPFQPQALYDSTKTEEQTVLQPPQNKLWYAHVRQTGIQSHRSGMCWKWELSCCGRNLWAGPQPVWTV